MDYEEIQEIIKRYQDDGFENIDIVLIDGNTLTINKKFNSIHFNKTGDKIKVIGMGYCCEIDFLVIKNICV